MAAKGTTRAMSERHEAYLAELFDGRTTRNSGAGVDKTDGRERRIDLGDRAFAWDGKSTMAASISITREMWDKTEEQAHPDLPLVPLRFYDNHRLEGSLDLVVIHAEDLANLIRRARGD
jgi:hypothetical protein